MNGKIGCLGSWKGTGPAGRQPESSAFTAISRRIDRRLENHKKKNKSKWLKKPHVKYHHEAHINKSKKLGFACSCSFSTLNTVVLEYGDESEDTCGAEFIVHLTTQGNEIQTQGFPSNAKGSLVAAPLLPLQPPPHPGLRHLHSWNSGAAKLKSKERKKLPVRSGKKTDYEQLHIYNASQRS